MNNGNRNRNNDPYSDSNKQFIELIKNNDQVGLSSIMTDGDATGSNFCIEEVNRGDLINNISNQNERLLEREDNLINDRITLLHVAAYYDSLECFVYLHKIKNYNIRIFSSRSFLPLHYACYNGSMEVTGYILREDASEILLCKNNLLLCFAVHGNNAKILEELFQHGAILRKVQNNIYDPIGKAISVDNYESCEILTRYSEGYSTDFSPAMTAAKMVNAELVRFLVKKPSDLDFSDLVHKSVFSLIFEISDGQKFRELIIEWLSKWDDIELEPPMNLHMNGVCHWACKLGDPDAAKLMFRTNNVYINRIGINNHLGTYYLANKNNNMTDHEIITMLNIMISNGFDINFQPEGGYCESTLKSFLRTIRIRYEVIDFLISKGADPNLPWSEDRTHTILDDVKKRKNDKKLMKIFEKFL